MPKDKKQIAFTGTEDYRLWIGDQARKKRMKVQKFLENAAASYAAEPIRPVTSDPEALPEFPYSHEERELIGALLRFLRDIRVPPTLRNVLKTLLNEWKNAPGDKKGKIKTG